MNLCRSIAIGALITLSSCGFKNNQGQSTTKDIATPGELGERNTLYWYDNDTLKVGTCQSNELPVLQNCQENVNTLSFIHVEENIREFINADISFTDEEITELTKTLRERHPTIIQLRSDIAGIKK